MIVKVAGGASILDDTNYFRIGQKNITAMRKIFWRNNVLIDGEDTGENFNRTVKTRTLEWKMHLKEFEWHGKRPMMIDSILKSVDMIPAFPATIQKVAELLRDDDYAVADVVNVIKYDQAIAANILKISNSAYFSARQKIKTIHDAVVYLGQQQLIRAVQTAGISKIYKKGGKGYVSQSKDLWEHAVAVALMSQILSRKIQGKEDQVLYTAALLHDVGKIIMGEYVHESFEKIMSRVKSEQMFLS